MNVYLIARKAQPGNIPIPPIIHITDDDNNQVAIPVGQIGELIHQLFEIHSGKTQPISIEAIGLLTEEQREAGLDTNQDDHCIYITDTNTGKMVAALGTRSTSQDVQQAANEYLQGKEK